VKPQALVYLLGAMLAACSGVDDSSAELTVAELRDATYMNVLEEPVTLVDGRFEGEPFAPGAATRPVVTLVPGAMATGDLDGDETDEAIVALAYDAGGSGVFIYLAVVRERDGEPDNVATLSLGDRVRVTALSIDDGKILAELVEHGPNDPMCCPTSEVQREWLLQDGELVELGPIAGTRGSRFIGHLVWGHESRSFTECGGEREGWVINDAGDELVEVYEELTTAPYQPMFVEIRGTWEAAPREGFGAEYDEALRVTELLRAENEGFGCRLELDGALFIASGNEPFWRVQVTKDSVSLRTMESPSEAVFPAPGRNGQSPLITFRSDGPDSAIEITLEQRRCIDTMSGARFAWAATVDVGGRRLSGCAAEGL
jgi:uncharacterized membrane protein